jgi:hypothetical protein
MPRFHILRPVLIKSDRFVGSVSHEPLPQPSLCGTDRLAHTWSEQSANVQLEGSETDAASQVKKQVLCWVLCFHIMTNRGIMLRTSFSDFSLARMLGLRTYCINVPWNLSDSYSRAHR